MKRNNTIKNVGFRGSLLLLLTWVLGGWQPLSAQSHCVPTCTNNFNYQCGISNVIMGSISNNTGTPDYQNFYRDYTSMFASAGAGSTVNFSLLSGPSNNTSFGIYIDWNRDGSFSGGGE